jgi:hypothetical protein
LNTVAQAKRFFSTRTCSRSPASLVETLTTAFLRRWLAGNECAKHRAQVRSARMLWRTLVEIGTKFEQN